MTKVSNRNPNRKAKYAAHPQKAIKNKLRKMAKHFKLHPNDKQTGSKL